MVCEISHLRCQWRSSALCGTWNRMCQRGCLSKKTVEAGAWASGTADDFKHLFLFSQRFVHTDQESLSLENNSKLGPAISKRGL